VWNSRWLLSGLTLALRWSVLGRESPDPVACSRSGLRTRSSSGTRRWRRRWKRSTKAYGGREKLAGTASLPCDVTGQFQLPFEGAVAPVFDPLTKLPDGETARLWLSHLSRDRRGCVLLLVNLNGFHAVNKAAGFDAGDQVLRDLSSALSVFTSAGTVTRLTGDWFLVLTLSSSLDDVWDLIPSAQAAIEQVPYPLSPEGRWTATIAAVAIHDGHVWSDTRALDALDERTRQLKELGGFASGFDLL
jgi:diguanylate cyclase (GGDEF)-like protein